MNLITGSLPPLHKRFDQKKSIKYIKNRYKGLREDIFPQVEVLQQDSGICRKFQSYYEKGYKDWVILSAVFNCMLNWKSREMGYGLKTPVSREKMEQERKRVSEVRMALKETVYPPSWFHMSDMEHHLKINSLQVLTTYGFELRRVDFKPEVVERFLQDRMKHYEYDLPHLPLFGEPPGNWPRC